MNKNVKRDKWMHLRLTEKECQQLQRRFKQTTYRKMSDFARQILLEKPVVIKVRNASLDDFMAVMILLRSELNAIGNNYNQVVKKLHALQYFGDLNSWLTLNESAQKIIQSKIEEIKSKINQINDKWLQ